MIRDSIFQNEKLFLRQYFCELNELNPGGGAAVRRTYQGAVLLSTLTSRPPPLFPSLSIQPLSPRLSRRCRPFLALSNASARAAAPPQQYNTTLNSKKERFHVQFNSSLIDPDNLRDN